MPSSMSFGTNWMITFTVSGRSPIFRSKFKITSSDFLSCFRFTGRVLEFIVGLFLLCNSAFILIFESGGAIRAVLVGLHAYFNLWCEARAGWKIFTRRRTAVHKIATLETVENLDQLDDVCAICFHDLKSNGSVNVIINYFHSSTSLNYFFFSYR